MPLLNDFLLGADPEFVVVRDGHIVQYPGRARLLGPWGLDHGNWVVEPHPQPDLSVRKLVANLKVSFNDFAVSAPDGSWRAGAYLAAPERTVTLGGHVHIDKPGCAREQLQGLDLFVQHLEKLDILPADECSARRRGNYGQYGDIRVEHGHFEYRTFPSWLYSQRVTKLCLLGTKLIMVDPAAPAETLGGVAQSSLNKLRSFFERFQNKDADVDWILGSGMLSKRLTVKPDRDLRDVWQVVATPELTSWKAEAARKKEEAPREAVRPPLPNLDAGTISSFVTINHERYRIIRPVALELTPIVRARLRPMVVNGAIPLGEVVPFGASWIHVTRMA